MTVKYFSYPFGVDGNLTTIPDPTQGDGSLSYQQGFGPDYSLVNTDPSSLTIPRDQFNQLMFDATSAIQQLQQNGFPVHVTAAMNDGAAYAYYKNSYVRATNGNVYYSLVDTNTDVPPSSKWQLVGASSSLYFNYAADTGTADHYVVAPNPAITAYQNGDVVILNPVNANTGACDINVNGLGIVSIKTQTNTNPGANSLIPTGCYVLVYKGGSFIVTNPSASASASTAIYYKAITAASYTVLLGDQNYFIDFTGTANTAFVLPNAGTLPNGWYCYIRNNGTLQASITLTSGGGNIDGLSTYVMYPGEERLIECNGTVFHSLILKGFFLPVSVANTGLVFVTPPGYQGFDCSLWAGGGGGGVQNSGSFARPVGGGGGGYNEAYITAVIMGTTQTITVGDGGTGGSYTVNGTAGGVSSIGTILKAYGGGSCTVSGSNGSIGGGGGGSPNQVGSNGSGTVGGDGGGTQTMSLTGAGATGVGTGGFDGWFGGGGGWSGNGGGHISSGGSSINGFGGGGGGGSLTDQNIAANASGGHSIHGGGGGGGGYGFSSGQLGAGGISINGGNGGTGAVGAVPGGGGGGGSGATHTGYAGGAGQVWIRGIA